MPILPPAEHVSAGGISIGRVSGGGLDGQTRHLQKPGQLEGPPDRILRVPKDEASVLQPEAFDGPDQQAQAIIVHVVHRCEVEDDGPVKLGVERLPQTLHADHVDGAAQPEPLLGLQSFDPKVIVHPSSPLGWTLSPTHDAAASMDSTSRAKTEKKRFRRYRVRSSSPRVETMAATRLISPAIRARVSGEGAAPSRCRHSWSTAW